MSATLRAAWLVCAKDLRVEARSGEVVITTALFATLLAVLGALSLYVNPHSARLVAPGVLWIALSFAGILAMGRAWSREREHDAFSALLLSPIPRAAIYLGKMLASLVFLALIEAILLLEVAVLFQLDLAATLGPLVALLVLGGVGFAATGNLFAALGVRARGRDMLLAVIVFPIVAPVLLSGVVATRELLGGAPVREVWGWMQILLAFDVAFLTAGVVLFESLVAD